MLIHFSTLSLATCSQQNTNSRSFPPLIIITLKPDFPQHCTLLIEPCIPSSRWMHFQQPKWSLFIWLSGYAAFWEEMPRSHGHFQEDSKDIFIIIKENSTLCVFVYFKMFIFKIILFMLLFINTFVCLILLLLQVDSLIVCVPLLIVFWYV